MKHKFPSTRQKNAKGASISQKSFGNLRKSQRKKKPKAIGQRKRSHNPVRKKLAKSKYGDTISKQVDNAKAKIIAIPMADRKDHLNFSLTPFTAKYTKAAGTRVQTTT